MKPSIKLYLVPAGIGLGGMVAMDIARLWVGGPNLDFIPWSIAVCAAVDIAFKAGIKSAGGNQTTKLK